METNLLKKAGKKVELAGFTTYRIGGPADYFFSAKNKEEFIEIIIEAKKLKLPFLVLGGGSNILFSDKGYKGLVIKCDICDLELKENKIYCGAGTRLIDIVKLTKQEGYTGLEWLAGIPGAIGGAIYGNAQAFGKKICESLDSVEVFDIKSKKVLKLKPKDCKFLSKDSVFKKNKNLIIISAILKVKKGDVSEIDGKIKEFLAYRKLKHPLEYPSAGSVFVNPEKKIKNKKLLKEFPELVEFNKYGVIHAGYLIEKAGLRGKKIGEAQISEKHGNFIINLGGAKAKDVIKLINLAKQKVKAKFKIQLKEEIQIIK